MALPLIPIISALTSIAPSIAGWFGGDKAEDAAQKVTDIARKVAGVNDPQNAVSKVLADPAMQLEFMKQLEQNKVTFDQMYLEDRQDAREKHKHSKMPAILSVTLTAGLLLFIAALMYVNIPDANQRLIDTVFGSYLTAWLSSIGYWFGTTRGSAEKTKHAK